MAVDKAESKSPDNAPSLAKERKEDRDLENHKRETLKDLLRQQVLHVLGKPAGLLRVQVSSLWDRNYRVNVFVGVDAASAKIASSYFVMADSDGNILEATPRLEKRN
jgi:hypothetical protein